MSRSQSKPAAPLLSDRIELGSAEVVDSRSTELAALAESSALMPLEMRGPSPRDLPRLVRGGTQDDGRDLVSSGLRLPGSFLSMAPKRDRRLVAAAPTRSESLYSNRFGPKKAEALARYGGTEETERAVAAGLRYLAGIQSDSGYWGSRRRDHEKYGEVYIGKTALCLLAFLGAGHTHQSDTEHSEVVDAAIDFLLSKQDEETKHFGRRTSSYSHGISTYALAECYAITGDPRLREPLEGAVSRILDQQSISSDTRNRGGWGYFSPTLSPEDPFTRTSVSAWMIMALKSAELSGIEFPEESKRAAKSYLWRMFDRERRYFLYSKDPSRLRSAWRTLPASTPAGVFGLQLLGEDSGDDRLEAALQFTTERAPASYRKGSDDDFVLRATGNVYFWYYGSLATFMAGGDAWERWNERLRTVLPEAQNLDGSFSAVGAYARY
ncbi:MAG: prenyltransferase/squalene oxidase repeat-containing protein, partial [Planctomycetota bacterium]